MKIEREKAKLVVDDILCDVCNQSTKKENGFNSGSLIGFFSSKNYEIDMCELCFNKTLAMLRSFRRQNGINTTNNNPLEGIKNDRTRMEL
jgi:hypothetical protein